jgi:hypothetical protein
MSKSDSGLESRTITGSNFAIDELKSLFEKSAIHFQNLQKRYAEMEATNKEGQKAVEKHQNGDEPNQREDEESESGESAETGDVMELGDETGEIDASRNTPLASASEPKS